MSGSTFVDLTVQFNCIGVLFAKLKEGLEVALVVEVIRVTPVVNLLLRPYFVPFQHRSLWPTRCPQFSGTSEFGSKSSGYKNRR